ncbi:MAG: hypothetical protein ACREBY_07035 [Polaromonas sp.]
MDYNNSTAGVLPTATGLQTEGSLSSKRPFFRPDGQVLATPRTAITTMPMTDQRSGACENTSQPASVAW